MLLFIWVCTILSRLRNRAHSPGPPKNPHPDITVHRWLYTSLLMHHSLQNGTPSTHTTRFSNLHFQTYICLMQAFHSGRKANALAGVQGQSISRKRGSEQWQLLPLRGCAGVRVCWEPLSLFKSCEVFILYVTELFCCTIINFFCSDTHSIKKNHRLCMTRFSDCHLLWQWHRERHMLTARVAEARFWPLSHAVWSTTRQHQLHLWMEAFLFHHKSGTGIYILTAFWVVPKGTRREIKNEQNNVF